MEKQTIKRKMEFKGNKKEEGKRLVKIMAGESTKGKKLSRIKKKDISPVERKKGKQHRKDKERQEEGKEEKGKF